jgi:glycosyltransferase involved in cell wall biosynthesis
MGVLHVAMPVYNERETLEPCLRRVVGAPLPRGWSTRIELVDDHSSEEAFAAARAAFERLVGEGHAATLHRHPVNRGKGAALRTAFDAILAGGAPAADLVVVQDADLEYDPGDFARLMEPILAGRVDAVLGTRWGAHRTLPNLKHRVHALGNAVLTMLSNLMTGYRVSDMECCYKLVTVGLLRRLRPMLTEERFGIEPQFVAGLRLGATVEEVPIRYAPRGPGAGKKIGWIDAVRAVWVIARERCRRVPAPEIAGAPHDAAAVRPHAPTSTRAAGRAR